MDIRELDDILERHGVKATANRMLVLKEMAGSDVPLSLSELESMIGTMDKSSIFRVLTVLMSHHVIHAMEDGRGIAKYELCHGKDTHSIDDMHVHFYCENCQKVYCFDNISIPEVCLPAGFSMNSANYMLKGQCPDCNAKHRND